MPEPTTDKNEVLFNVDDAIQSIDIVESDTKKGDKRFKYVRLSLTDGKVINWYPFLRTTVPQLEKLQEEFTKAK